MGIPTELPLDKFTPFIVQSQEQKALYVTVKNGNHMLSTLTGGKPGKLVKQNNDLRILPEQIMKTYLVILQVQGFGTVVYFMIFLKSFKRNLMERVAKQALCLMLRLIII